MAYKKQTSPLSPEQRAVHDVLDAIENDRISQREATRPIQYADIVSPDRVQRFGNTGRNFNYPVSEQEYYLNSQGDVERASKFTRNPLVVYEASANALGLPIKAYEQIYRELGPEGISHKKAEEHLLKYFPQRTPQHMREGPYGRVIVPTGTNQIQVANSKQDPRYYEALSNQQFNLQRYYEMEFDRLRGIGINKLGLSLEDEMKRFKLSKSLTDSILQISAPRDIFEASALQKEAEQKKLFIDMVGGDVNKQYDRQLFLQSMLAIPGKFGDSPIPELYRKVQESIKEARGALPPYKYNFDVDNGSSNPDHPYIGNYVNNGFSDGVLEGLPLESQKALLPAFYAMQNYNKQIYKIPELKPPLSQKTGRFDKGGYAGFVRGDLLTAPFKPIANVAHGLAEEDTFVTMLTKGLSNPTTARNFYSNYTGDSATRALVNSEIGASALKFAGKAGTAAAVGVTPFDALSRRDKNFTDFYERTRRDPTYAENMMLRVQSGLEPALNLATFGAYDALAETPTYKAYLDQEAKDLGKRKEIQAGIDFPKWMGTGGRTTR